MSIHQASRFTRDPRRAIMASRREIFQAADGHYFGTQGEAETHDIHMALKPSRGTLLGVALGAVAWVGGLFFLPF